MTHARGKDAHCQAHVSFGVHICYVRAEMKSFFFRCLEASNWHVGQTLKIGWFNCCKFHRNLLDLMAHANMQLTRMPGFGNISLSIMHWRKKKSALEKGPTISSEKSCETLQYIGHGVKRLFIMRSSSRCPKISIISQYWLRLDSKECNFFLTK